MIGSGLSVVIELIVSLLLVVTIGYCFIVNRKLTALRTDQTGLRQVIIELNRSSDRAEQAISQMRQTAQSVDGEMASNVEAARQAREGLQVQPSLEAIVMRAEKLSEIDISSLKAVERSSRGEAASSEQVAVSKELKRQRLGFGREQFKTPLQESEALVRRQAAAFEQAHRYAASQLQGEAKIPPLPPMNAGRQEEAEADGRQGKPVFGKKQKWMADANVLSNSGSLTPASLVMQSRQRAAPAEMPQYRESA